MCGWECSSQLCSPWTWLGQWGVLEPKSAVTRQEWILVSLSCPVIGTWPHCKSSNGFQSSAARICGSLCSLSWRSSRHILMTATIYFFKKVCPRQNMIVVGTEKKKRKKKRKGKRNNTHTNSSLPIHSLFCIVILPSFPLRDGYLLLLLESGLNQVNCFGHQSIHKHGVAGAWKLCTHWDLPSLSTFGSSTSWDLHEKSPA